jgi:hypothetical protein
MDSAADVAGLAGAVPSDASDTEITELPWSAAALASRGTRTDAAKPVTSHDLVPKNWIAFLREISEGSHHL